VSDYDALYIRILYILERGSILYIKRLVDKNVGPIEDINIEFPFNENKPYPIVIVGENGSGKSTLISNIVDALYELASIYYTDAKKTYNNASKAYYKMISPLEIKIGSPYMYSYIHFNDEELKFDLDYVLKSGKLLLNDFKRQVGLEKFSPVDWNETSNYKKVLLDNDNFSMFSNKTQDKVSKLFTRNVLCYFPPERYERPLWLGNVYYDLRKSEYLSLQNFSSNQIPNPIMVNDMTDANLKWMLDIIVDSRWDADLENGKPRAISNVEFEYLQKFGQPKILLERILSVILEQEVRFELLPRIYRNMRFQVFDAKTARPIIPSFESLSTGQSALFNMFATIIRYADQFSAGKNIMFKDIKGIVVIDEIELHLHAKFQREILPRLVSLFPSIQFIITTHSPLFLLGMKELFGEDGFIIYQMPHAERISVERFSEFQNAYKYLSETEQHEKDILESIKKHQGKMLIITEGSTDWKHLKAAYNKLKKKPELKDIFDCLEFEFLEYESNKNNSEETVTLDMGNKTLCSICKNIAKIPQERKIVFIADCDDNPTNKALTSSNKDFKNWGNNVFSFILPIPANRTNTPEISIEHLYSDETIKQEVENEAGNKRRLFMGNEFDERGISFNKKFCCDNRHKCGKGKINIIDGSSGEKVTSLDNAENNLALPKSKFANMILAREAPFTNVDFSNFIPIFKILKEISEQ
jgi:predicted ATPase